MADQQKTDDERARKASTVGTDTNEEMVANHPGFDKASDHPHPNEHIAGQTPAVETNQPTLGKQDELGLALGEVERVLSYAVHYEGGRPVIREEQHDAVVDALQNALGKAKAAKK